MASKKKPTTEVTHLLSPGGKTWCGFEQKSVTRKTNDPDASTCEGCTREWANVKIQSEISKARKQSKAVTATVVASDGKHPLVGMTWTRHDDGRVTDHRMRDEWDDIHYPEITDAENHEIRAARRAGYPAMFPAFPSADAQARSTLTGARAFMEARKERMTTRTDKRTEKTLKDDVDMSIVTRTTITLDGDDVDIINDMYMVLTRLLKIGSGDAKLVADGGEVLARYKGKKA